MYIYVYLIFLYVCIFTFTYLYTTENCKILNYPKGWCWCSRFNWGRWQGWKLFLLLESPFLLKPSPNPSFSSFFFHPNRVKGLTVHSVSIDFFFNFIFFSLKPGSFLTPLFLIFLWNAYPCPCQLPGSSWELFYLPIMCFSTPPALMGSASSTPFSPLMSLMSSVHWVLPLLWFVIPSRILGFGEAGVELWVGNLIFLPFCAWLWSGSLIYPIQNLGEFSPLPSRHWGIWFLPQKILRNWFERRRFQHQGSRTCKHKFKCSKFSFFSFQIPPKFRLKVVFMDLAVAQLLLA